jgi:hypothetical protein
MPHAVAAVTVLVVALCCLLLGRALGREYVNILGAIVFGLFVTVASVFLLFPILFSFENILGYHMPSGDNGLIFLQYVFPGPILFPIALLLGVAWKTKSIESNEHSPPP